MTILAVLGWFLLLPVALVAIVFIVEAGLGLLAGDRPGPIGTGRRPSVTILIPAHDEAGGITAMLGGLLSVCPTQARILLVADNCTDDTAAIARATSHRVEVIERRDPAQRGKGHALAFGRARLAASAALPDVVIVLDADCRIEPGGIERLATLAAAGPGPVQASYLLSPRADAPPMVQISTFAFLVKNLLRQRGLSRLGAPVPLTGTGMAFGWAAFAAAPLATSDLVEDLAIGVALAQAGRPPRFAPEVTVWSAPASAGATLVQRTRWEQGFMATARSHGLPLLATGLRGGRPRLAWLGLHLLTPPLALLVAAMVGVTAVLGVLALAGMPPLAFLVALSICLALVLVVLIAWLRHGRAIMKGSTIVRLPLYILWKLPIYARMLLGRGEKQWVRTTRED